ncbi:MAG: NUDIX domain-containing protein [Solirubrobacterales bacterium]|nr:NUDIX domain-containing protein [Solirubrobacterales bacterium]
MTASVLVWHRHEDGWRLGLVRHPLRCRLLPPGGHVEPHENTEEAALREVTEETGLAVDLDRDSDHADLPERRQRLRHAFATQHPDAGDLAGIGAEPCADHRAEVERAAVG